MVALPFITIEENLAEITKKQYNGTNRNSNICKIPTVMT